MLCDIKTSCYGTFRAGHLNVYITVRTKGSENIYDVVCFLLGDSPASDLYMPTFWNTLSVPSAFEDGTDRVFRNVGIYKSDAGESPKRKQTTF